MKNYSISKKTFRLITGVIVTIVVLLFGYLQKRQIVIPSSVSNSLYKEGTLYTVTKVFDGDTIELEGKARVRLIGIDTPEDYPNEKAARDSMRSGMDVGRIVAMGKQAQVFVKRLSEGKKVRLEFDVEKKDKYGRLLAYIYLQDGTFVNAKIIERGYAQPMTIPPNVKYTDLLKRLYGEARKNKRGLWSD